MHVEALQRQQALIENQIEKLKARLAAAGEADKDALTAKIATLERKVAAIDDSICELL